MIKRLRLKFVLVNMSIVLVLLGIILGMVSYFTRANLEAESVNMMQTITERPFALGSPGKPEKDVRLPYFIINFGPDGELSTSNSGYYDLSDTEFLDELLQIAFSSQKKWGIIEEYNLRYYRVDTPKHTRVVFADISSEIATRNSLTKNCILIGTLSFFAFLAVSIFLSKWAVRPVEAAWRQQRQFVADASHELKTPLTVILANAEFLQSPVYDEREKSRFSQNVLTMAQKMRGLIEQLLELARLDSGQAQMICSRIDFSKLVSDAVLPYEPVFYEKGLRLESKVEDGISVSGGAEPLSNMVGILLDNAQKYSAEAGATLVSLEKRGGSACLLRVQNEGAALSADELAHVFKRFYRADQARHDGNSFGLGLSIAQSIAAQHKGRIWAESRDGRNTFFVELPLA